MFAYGMLFESHFLLLDLSEPSAKNSERCRNCKMPTYCLLLYDCILLYVPVHINASVFPLLQESLSLPTGGLILLTFSGLLPRYIVLVRRQSGRHRGYTHSTHTTNSIEKCLDNNIHPLTHPLTQSLTRPFRHPLTQSLTHPPPSSSAETTIQEATKPEQSRRGDGIHVSQCASELRSRGGFRRRAKIGKQVQCERASFLNPPAKKTSKSNQIYIYGVCPPEGHIFAQVNSHTYGTMEHSKI